MNIMPGFVVCLCLTLVGGAWASEEGTPKPQTLILEPTPARPLRIDFNYNFRNALPPFEKEPALPGKQLARGLIPTVPPTPLLRNISDNELYLSVNHSPDLTTGNIATYKSTYNGHVYFRDLKVSSTRGDLKIPYTVDLFTYEVGCAGWLHVQSGWAGELDMNGHKWRLILVDNLDGVVGDGDTLYLERDPSEARGKVPALQFDNVGRSVAITPAPKRLFLEGHVLELSFAFVRGAEGTVVEVTLSETKVPLGKVAIAAQGCRYIRLSDEDMDVVLNANEGTVSAPVGTYHVTDCVLDGSARQPRQPAFIRCDRSLSVRAGETASLELGLPLSNTVQVKQDRNLLRLTFQVLGKGGEQYEYYNWRERPRFGIYRGPVKVGTGTLPFG